VLPDSEFPAMIVLERFGNQSCGINLLNGMTADNHPTTVRGQVFHPGKATRIVCRVEGSSIAVHYVDRISFRWSGPPSRIQLDERFWTNIPGDRISLTVFSANTGFWISQVLLTNLPRTPGTEIASDSPPPSFGPGVGPGPRPWFGRGRPPVLVGHLRELYPVLSTLPCRLPSPRGRRLKPPRRPRVGKARFL